MIDYDQMESQAQARLQIFINEQIDIHLMGLASDIKHRELWNQVEALGYDVRSKTMARQAWWDHCESLTGNHVPTFKEFWNNAATYAMVA